MAQITLKLFASLQKHLPPGTKGARAHVEVQEGATVGAVLELLGVPRPATNAIVVNGEHVTWEAPVSDGDTVSVFPPLIGG